MEQKPALMDTNGIVLFETSEPSEKNFIIETNEDKGSYRILKPNKEFYQWVKENRIQLILRDDKNQLKIGNFGCYYDDKYDVPETNIKTLFFIYSYFCNCQKGNTYHSTFDENGLQESSIMTSKWATYYYNTKKEKKKLSNLFGLIKKNKCVVCTLNIYGPFTKDPRYLKHQSNHFNEGGSVSTLAGLKDKSPRLDIQGQLHQLSENYKSYLLKKQRNGSRFSTVHP